MQGGAQAFETANDSTRRLEQPRLVPAVMPDLILVTGSDFTHARALRHFLASIDRFEPALSVIVYDLGLTPAQLKGLKRTFRRYEFRKFDYERYPGYFCIRINAGEFAWKPVIVWQVLSEARRPVCWMDAGNRLTENLDRLRASLLKSGFYSPRSVGCIPEWTHPKMLEFFGLAPHWGDGKENLNGACVAFNPRFEPALALARKWNEGALIRACIAPEGSDRTNHRQDQALLSVLAHQAGLADSTARELLGFLIQCDRVFSLFEDVFRSLVRLLIWATFDPRALWRHRP